MAAHSPIPIFPVAGADAVDEVRDLRLRAEVELVASPRHASVLLVAGQFGEDSIPGLALVHDQVPLPRVTMRWAGDQLVEIPQARFVDGDEGDLIGDLVTLDREMLTSPERSEPPLLPDVDSVEWRGVGPYGHGGKGMTGGTPYGRPLADRAPDRDGLELDQLPVTIGPWIGVLPPGLQLEVKLQGDLIQKLEVGPLVVSAPRGDIFSMAEQSPVSVAALELERARHHLRWLSDALAIQGLPALGIRALRLARTLTTTDRESVDRLLKTIRRSGVLGMTLKRVGGGTTGMDPAGLGPVARAAGLEEDARLDDPTYRELGFRPVLGDEGDTAARWRQRMAEIVQSLDLANVAGDRTAFGAGVVEHPRGRVTPDSESPSAALMGLLPELLPGLEWGDAVSVLWSLDIDPFARTRADVLAGVET